MASSDPAKTAQGLFILSQLGVERFLSRARSSNPEEHLGHAGNDAPAPPCQVPLNATETAGKLDQLKRVKKLEPEYTPTLILYFPYFPRRERPLMGFTTDDAPACPHLGTQQHPLALAGTPQVPSSRRAGLSPALDLILDLQIIQLTASGLFALPVLLLFKNLSSIFEQRK